MSDIDELFRHYLVDVPPAPPGALERITRRATSEPPRRRVGLRLRRWRPRLLAVAGGLAAAALATVLAVLFIKAPNAGGPAGEPRVDWGMNVVLQVVPEPGASLDEAVDRAVVALEERGRSQDIPGLGIERLGGGGLKLTVPGAKQKGSVFELINFSSMAVYERSATLIAYWTNTDEAKAGLRALTGPPGGFITLPRVRRPGDELGLPDYRKTRAAADELIAFLNATVPNEPDKQYEAVPIPAGIRFRDNPPGIDVLRDEPIVAASDIAGVEVAGSDIVLEIRNGARDRVVQAVKAATNRTPPANLDVLQTFQGPVGQSIGTASLADGRVAIRVTSPLGAERVAAAAGRPVVPAHLEITSAEPYGAIPPPAGDRLTELPPEIDQARHRTPDPRSADARTLDLPRDAIVRAVTASLGRRTVELYVGRTPVGDDVVFSRGGVGGGTGCDGQPGPPSLIQCAGNGTGSEWTYYGRVGRPDIATVELRTGAGRVFPGAVKNGWYLILANRDGAFGPDSTFIARNATGDEVARINATGLHLTR